MSASRCRSARAASYSRQVAGFVEWLGADPARGGDALADPFARDYAVRDFKRHLKLKRRWSPASVNLALAAVDHFLRFIGLGAAAPGPEDSDLAGNRPFPATPYEPARTSLSQDSSQASAPGTLPHSSPAPAV